MLQRIDEQIDKRKKDVEAIDLERKMGLSEVGRAEAEYLEKILKELAEKKVKK